VRDEDVAVWVLPEEVRVRRAVGDGIGRAMRDRYPPQSSESLPAQMKELLGRLDHTSVTAASRGADEDGRRVAPIAPLPTRLSFSRIFRVNAMSSWAAARRVHHGRVVLGAAASRLKKCGLPQDSAIQAAPRLEACQSSPSTKGPFISSAR